MAAGPPWWAKAHVRELVPPYKFAFDILSRMSNTPSEVELLKTRLATVETLLMHVERDLQDLNQAVLGQDRRLDVLEQEVRKFVAAMEKLSSSQTEQRKPEEEIPPHY